MKSKSKLFVLSVIFTGCFFVFQTGCQQQAKTTVKPQSAAETTPEVKESAGKALPPKPAGEDGDPKIEFEKTIHDFGEIAPKARRVCQFKFKNTGNATLKITKVTKTCGCTPFTLAKKEYAPGETGILKVRYNANNRPGAVKKRLTILSNDKSNPKVTITIKARVVQKISYSPKTMKLILKDENAGCPDITLTSLDKQPFAITQFKAKGGCIAADFDPSKKAVKFVLHPRVDKEKLRTYLNGSIDITLTHPGCKKVVIFFSTLPEFSISPPSINILKTRPKESTKREVWVLSNYDSNFEVESVSSRNGFVKVLSREKVGKRYKFMVEITAPDKGTGQRFFTDTIFVQIKGGRKLEIMCRGFYSRKK